MEAPQIICPADIEAETQEQQDSANITWQIPTAKDNSGEKVRFEQIFVSLFQMDSKYTINMCAIENFQYSNDCTVSSCTLLINANVPSDNRIISLEFFIRNLR